jgi:hypothetical protein
MVKLPFNIVIILILHVLLVMYAQQKDETNESDAPFTRFFLL